MEKLNVNEQKKIMAGAFSASFFTSVYKSINVFTDLGRYLGSSIRRIYEKKYCKY